MDPNSVPPPYLEALFKDLRVKFPGYLESFMSSQPIASQTVTLTQSQPQSGSPLPGNAAASPAIPATPAPLVTQRHVLPAQVVRPPLGSQSAARDPRVSASGRPATPIPAPSVGPSAPNALPGPSAHPKGTLPPSRESMTRTPTNTVHRPSAMDICDIPESQGSPAPVDDGFTVVVSNRKRRKATKTDAQPTTTSKVTVTESQARSQTLSDSDSESEDSPMEEPRKEKIPPMFIRDKDAWANKIVPMLIKNNIPIPNAQLTTLGIRAECESSGDHRRLTALLRSNSIGYHTYALSDERVLRVVVRGLPKELDTELIKADLLKQDLPVQEVHRMYRSRSKEPLDLCLVILELSPEGKRIYNLKAICHLSGLSFEKPNNRGRIGQCHRCQTYGHSQRNCFARPRCVKCLGDHGTIDCPRKERIAEVPPSCVLCGEAGHPANYRGCRKAPQPGKRRGRAAGRKPAAPKKPAHRFVPAPVPTTNAWNKPLYGAPNAPSAAPASPVAKQPPRAAPAAQPSLSAPQASSKPSYATHSFSDVFSMEEYDLFIEKYKVDPLRAIGEHSIMLRAIENYKNFLNGSQR
ncbi:uncharacterized protein LOC128199707 [Bicyclus anynana]|uniref:Uncharacterized protein LOC128199707 n=1 Tax=Bicyclus anynana TaxID=110368 RepID=A0ABM3M4V1_BICAN|nr:uncharacterized protein LOC128199707 [Bicyclus anynana]